MYIYLLTKHDPKKYYFENGIRHYYKNDWIDITDIGKDYNGKILTDEEYMEIENIYVEFFIKVCDFYKIKKVEISDLIKSNKKISKNNINSLPKIKKEKLFKEYKNNLIEKSRLFPNLYNDEMINIALNIKNGTILNKSEIDYIIRMMLRKDMYCIIGNKKIIYDSGYDMISNLYCKYEIDESLIETLKEKLFIIKM